MIFTIEEAGSLTVTIEFMHLTCIMNAFKNRDAIPGAFLLAKVDEIVHIRLEAAILELLEQPDPKLYGEHATLINGKVP